MYRSIKTPANHNDFVTISDNLCFYLVKKNMIGNRTIDRFDSPSLESPDLILLKKPTVPLFFFLPHLIGTAGWHSFHSHEQCNDPLPPVSETVAPWLGVECATAIFFWSFQRRRDVWERNIVPCSERQRHSLVLERRVSLPLCADLSGEAARPETTVWPLMMSFGQRGNSNDCSGNGWRWIKGRRTYSASWFLVLLTWMLHRQSLCARYVWDLQFAAVFTYRFEAQKP